MYLLNYVDVAGETRTFEFRTLGGAIQWADLCAIKFYSIEKEG